MKYRLALYLQLSYLVVALVTGLPGSWQMFSRAQRLHYQVSARGVPLEVDSYRPPWQLLNDRRQVERFFAFLCQRLQTPLKLELQVQHEESTRACP